MPQLRKYVVPVGSAMGGALLVFLGQVANEEYKTYRQERIAAEAAAQAAVAAKEKEQLVLIDAMMAQAQALAPTATRAGDYVSSGRGGSKKDVDDVARHYRLLIKYIRNDRIGVYGAAAYYGGALAFWAERFKMISDGSSPVAKTFLMSERESFRLLSEALVRMRKELGVPERDEFSAVADDPAAASPAVELSR